MSIRKELKKAYLKLTGQYKKMPKLPKMSGNIPYEVFVTNIITEEDLQKNRQFITEMRKHHFTEPPKSILCFLPYSSVGGFLSGGYRTILAINDSLSQIFQAKIYLCFFPVVEGQEFEMEFSLAVEKHFPQLNFEIVSYSKVFDLHVDIAMCNFWLGAYPLVKFNNCKEKYNLVQDHESRFYNNVIASLAEQTLSFGFNKICNSKALKKYLEFVDKESSVFRYFPGIDHNLYYSPPLSKTTKKTYKIIFYGRPSIPRNAFNFLIPVLQKVKEVLGNKVQIISVGENYNVNTWNLNGIVNNYGKLNSLEELAELYRQCDIGISLITTPTFSYQHLEFMASGLCLVTNKQPGIDDFLFDNKNAVVCELGIDIMADRIIKLINNPSEISSIATNGVRDVNRLNWNECFQSIAEYIMSDKRRSHD